MIIDRVIVGLLDTNCYLIKNKDNYLIVDPGAEPEKIISKIDGNVKGIIITHYHFDHIGALEELKDKYNCPIYDYSNLKEGINNIDDFSINVIYTPGHKSDHISILLDNDLIAGDFIFKGTIGRYDLPTGSIIEMQKSINKILKYNNLKIYPGHGEYTTLEEERINLESYL